jgi:2-desacetyl-2-hydroxyethyl bacteriochlorophyllide A dehydrogenase
MKVARLFGPKELRVVDMPKPTLAPDEVLCKVKRAGVCGTDYAIYSGEFSFVKSGQIRFPMTCGHEWSGVVDSIGSTVTAFQPGDRVVGDTVVSCGICQSCLLGKYMHCSKLRCVGTINTWDGAYSEFIVMPQRHLFHLSKNISFDNAAFIEPAATALYSVRLADVQIGDTVLVLGSGPIGIAAAKLAAMAGASKVVIAARKKFKLDKAVALGVHAAVNLADIKLEDAIQQEFGPGGVDRIIEASGSIELFKKAAGLINPGGTISVVAFYETQMHDFEIDQFVFRDLKIRGVAGSLGMYGPLLKLLANGLVDFSSLITSYITLGQLPENMKTWTERENTRIKEMIKFD